MKAGRRIQDRKLPEDWLSSIIIGPLDDYMPQERREEFALPATRRNFALPKNFVSSMKWTAQSYDTDPSSSTRYAPKYDTGGYVVRRSET